jgi:hypothetical protein
MVAARRHDDARSASVCSVGNTPDKFAFRPDPVAQHILDWVVTWQTAVRVLGSAGWTRPPTPAAQLARRCPDMSIEAHVEALQRRHRALETEIAEAHAHPSIDDLEIVSLKRRKLLVKDELARLKN